jgi:F-type H+-transporting ATPase subunit c
MEYDALKFIGAGLATLGMLGAAIGIGHIGAAFLTAIARNPALEQRLTKQFFIAAALSEAMGLFAFVIAAILLFVVK